MSGRPNPKAATGRGKVIRGSTSATKTSTGAASTNKQVSGETGAKSKALVPRGQRGVATRPGPQQQSMIVPEGYSVRKIEPAKNYDVVSYARAMNPDLGPKVQKLFEPERDAALQAQQTGIYIGWRCSDFKHDCQRVGTMSKCFCGHLLGEHAKHTGHSVRVPCKQAGCKCKGFAWIPSRPEEIGEFWFQRRRGFDVTQWRAKCRCKHTHEEHDPTGLRRCKARGCGCGAFDSPFLCAACDRHWEAHETVFETADDRVKNGMQVGADYLPFSEIPSLRNMVLTGEDDGDMTYMRMQQDNRIQRALPSSEPTTNDMPFPSGGGAGPNKAGFRPVYD